MITALKIWIVASALSALVAAQSTDCEKTCESKMKAAIKCSTLDCYCYALDDPTVDGCLRAECGRGYDSIRRINVDVCAGFGVTLDPSPSAGTASGPSPTGTSSGGTGSGSGGGASSTNGANSGSQSGTSSNSASSDKSGSQPTKERLTTAELIGIIIGSISAVTAIIGLWVTIKRRKDKTVSRPTQAYQPLPPQTNVAFAPVQNIHVSPHAHAPFVAPMGPPPRYQPVAPPIFMPAQAQPGYWKR